ncbi:alpha-hydroxy acid oxidase [Aerobium aerolatum]|uniref:L-lactate dehydrogenase (Cytochrome) n=1 Tax=Aquamicrobium aerolatum DSM 21857 TaxID=1121003 RepID=A0A1I3RAS3_9HYPH|nr:alpha-hydroxy acid oxidase [Aquamicrobium aerolatum]SFJ42286.1 L-lactate dehydrogenase (cytochrome) [Aquamicrobium aerolatum DSM 21857]
MLLNYSDYRKAARYVLPRGLFEYIDRGTEDEHALTRIRDDLNAIQLVPRIFSRPGDLDLSVELFGERYATPLIIAPTALAGMLAYNGEQKLARAAGRNNLTYCAATQSVSSIEDIAAGAPDSKLWFQLYYWKNHELTRDLLVRSNAAGIRTLVVTADTPTGPKREYNQRNRFGVPFEITVRGMIDVLRHPRWFTRVLLRYLLTSGMPSYGNYPAQFHTPITRRSIRNDVALDHALTWNEIADLRGVWNGNIIIKGILSAKDAERAASLGMDGIVVSAHGGRNLDIAPTPARVLPDIRKAVGKDLCIIADSGVTRGTDILKYLALGADAVMAGRLPLWGLAAADERGAGDVLAMLIDEMKTAMTMLGANSLIDIQELERTSFT